MQPATRADSDTVRPPRTIDPAVLGEAFRRLYDRQLDYVARTLQRLGVREADLDDQCQEVFVRVHAKLGALTTPRERPWLFAFAARVAANYRRLARHREVSDERAIERRADDAGDDPERSLMRDDARRLVLAGLAALDFDRRVALVAHDIDELSAPQIAELLGIPLNTVYSRIRLARIDVKKAVARLRRTEPGDE